MPNLSDQIKTLYHIHLIIASRRRGSSDEIREQLGMGKTQFYRHLDILRNLGAKINRDPLRQYYFYEEKFDFNIGYMRS